MSERVWTVMEILQTARDFFGEKGIENPRGNAEALLCKTLDLPRIELYIQHDRPLTAEQVTSYRELLKRRVHHEPLQLILGSVEFCGVTIGVAPGVLIPRPETEELAEFVVQSLKGDEPKRILDIGTGTGCIAIAIAAKLPRSEVDAVELDFEAVRCATRNIEENALGSRVKVIMADLFSTRFETAVVPPYDAIVSNPPYVTAEEYETLAPEVRDHDPRHALVAESDGLAYYQRIATLLPTLLKPEGLLAVEIGFGQSERVVNVFSDVLNDVDVRHDLAGIPRIVAGRK